MHGQSHLRSLLAATAAFCVIAVLVTSPASAQSRILWIEEHWTLQVGEPEPDRSAPQASMVMSPSGDLHGQHFLFTLNHRGVPAYQAGGMQVELWDGDRVVEQQVGTADGPLSVPNEEIRWVQRLELGDGMLTFEILAGTSQTWGSFGGDGVLKLVASTPLADLNGYQPGISLTESEVSYGGNRVVSLTLSKLIWKTEDGQTHELNAPIDIDTDIDP